MTLNEIQTLLASSAHLDYTNPKWVKAEIVAVEGTNRFAVVGADTNGDDRIYGAVGGRWRANPVMTAKTAKSVAEYLLSDY